MRPGCQEVREKIHALLDGGGRTEGVSVPEDVLRHTKTCPECRSFMDLWRHLPFTIKAALDTELDSAEPLEIPRLAAKPRKRRFLLHPLAWAATLAAIALLSVFVYRGVGLYRSFTLLREENRIFLQNVFDRSFFEIDEDTLPADSITQIAIQESTWFDPSETTEELLGSFPLFAFQD